MNSILAPIEHFQETIQARIINSFSQEKRNEVYYLILLLMTSDIDFGDKGFLELLTGIPMERLDSIEQDLLHIGAVDEIGTLSENIITIVEV